VEHSKVRMAGVRLSRALSTGTVADSTAEEVSMTLPGGEGVG